MYTKFKLFFYLSNSFIIKIKIFLNDKHKIDNKDVMYISKD